jgi:dTDP-4-amino-4,6-dideoxygalactose transaminase
MSQTLDAAANMITALQAELADWRNSCTRVMSESCGDEKHCSCVPYLRIALAERMDELQGAAIDAELERISRMVADKVSETYLREIERLKKEPVNDDQADDHSVPTFQCVVPTHHG